MHINEPAAEKRRTPRSSRIAASVSRTGARTVVGCHTRRHWNSPSYRTAAGNVSNCWRVTAQSPRQLIHVPNGAEGARTPDLCNANAALSQLSYSPASAMAAGEQVSAPSTTQTETAPQPCGAAVTAGNLAGRPALSSRRVAEGSGNWHAVARQILLARVGARAHHVSPTP